MFHVSYLRLPLDLEEEVEQLRKDKAAEVKTREATERDVEELQKRLDDATTDVETCTDEKATVVRTQQATKKQLDDTKKALADLQETHRAREASCSQLSVALEESRAKLADRPAVPTQENTSHAHAVSKVLPNMATHDGKVGKSHVHVTADNTPTGHVNTPHVKSGEVALGDYVETFAGGDNDTLVGNTTADEYRDPDLDYYTNETVSKDNTKTEDAPAKDDEPASANATVNVDYAEGDAVTSKSTQVPHGADFAGAESEVNKAPGGEEITEDKLHITAKIAHGADFAGAETVDATVKATSEYEGAEGADAAGEEGAAVEEGGVEQEGVAPRGRAVRNDEAAAEKGAAVRESDTAEEGANAGKADAGVDGAEQAEAVADAAEEGAAGAVDAPEGGAEEGAVYPAEGGAEEGAAGVAGLEGGKGDAAVEAEDPLAAEEGAAGGEEAGAQYEGGGQQ